MKKSRTSVLLAAIVAAAAAQAQIQLGGSPVENRDSQWRVSGGAIMKLDGSVDETFRAFYAASGQNAKQSAAESYDLDEFGVDCPYYTLGLHYNKDWNFWAFRWDMMFFTMSADATARRNYYIGLGDEISYGGKDYDHLKIPGGADFSVDFAGGMTDLMFSFTPVTLILGDSIKLIPSIDIGITAIIGEYKIDAGAPIGTTVYQNPPVDFVVKGSSSSMIGIGAPTAGAGLELRVGPDDGTQWVSKANLGYFAYDGSTTPFTSAEHREKNADVTFLSAMAETGFRFPLENGKAFSLGARLQMIKFEGDITSDEKNLDRILSMRERFDKSVDFELMSAMVFAGISF